eukprot:352248-Chlamydomonas_euryale.AAC.2
MRAGRLSARELDRAAFLFVPSQSQQLAPGARLSALVPQLLPAPGGGGGAPRLLVDSVLSALKTTWGEDALESPRLASFSTSASPSPKAFRSLGLAASSGSVDDARISGVHKVRGGVSGGVRDVGQQRRRRYAHLWRAERVEVWGRCGLGSVSGGRWAWRPAPLPWTALPTNSHAIKISPPALLRPWGGLRPSLLPAGVSPPLGAHDSPPSPSKPPPSSEATYSHPPLPCRPQGTVVRGETDIPGGTLHVSDCHDTVVYVLSPLQFVHLSGCSDCTVVVGAVGKLLRVDRCDKVWGRHVRASTHAWANAGLAEGVGWVAVLPVPPTPNIC